jgi:hypothetical protein
MSAIEIYRQLETIAGGSDYFRLADQPGVGRSNHHKRVYQEQ